MSNCPFIDVFLFEIEWVFFTYFVHTGKSLQDRKEVLGITKCIMQWSLKAKHEIGNTAPAYNRFMSYHSGRNVWFIKPKGKLK